MFTTEDIFFCFFFDLLFNLVSTPIRRGFSRVYDDRNSVPTQNLETQYFHQHMNNSKLCCDLRTPMRADIHKASCVTNGFLETFTSAPTTKKNDDLSFCLVYLICLVRYLYIFAYPAIPTFFFRGTAMPIRIPSSLSLCISLISQLFSNHLSAKIVVSPHEYNLLIID